MRFSEENWLIYTFIEDLLLKYFKLKTLITKVFHLKSVLKSTAKMSGRIVQPYVARLHNKSAWISPYQLPSQIGSQ